MRQTSELLKVVTEREDPEEVDASSESDNSTDRGVSALESQGLEKIGFPRFQQLMRPLREAELTPARIDPHLATTQDANPEAAAQFNRLAIALIAGAVKRPPLKRVLLASAHHCEGRTSVTLNLAAALARAKQRVLVIDSDLMRPSVNRLLGVDSDVGLAEALADGLQPERAVTRLLPIGFDVLPTRAQVENSAELLASPAFGAMLSILDAHYDFILFDSAPLLASSDASLILLHTHATLMVVRPGTTTTSQMAQAVSLLSQESMFGVVLNRLT